MSKQAANKKFVQLAKRGGVERNEMLRLGMYDARIDDSHSPLPQGIERRTKCRTTQNSKHTQSLEVLQMKADVADPLYRQDLRFSATLLKVFGLSWLRGA